MIAPDAPIEISMKISLTNGDLTGHADYSFPPGRIPTRQDVADAIAKALASELVTEHGLRLMTRHEFVDQEIMPSPGTFAIPGPDRFDLEIPSAETDR